MIGLFFFALFLSLFFPVKVLFYFLYLFGPLWIFALAWTSRNRKGLGIKRDIARPELFWGEETEVKLKVRNQSLFPLPWLYLRDKFHHHLSPDSSYGRVFYLPAMGEISLIYRLRVTRRGYYPVGPWLAKSSDIFGIHPWELSEERPEYVMVYPRIIPVGEPGIPSKQPYGTVRSSIRIYEDPSRMVGLREYVTGDSRRRINWKVTARTGKLQVNVYQPSVSLGTMIFLNLNPSEYSRPEEEAMERGIVAAASIANYINGLRQEVGLVTNGAIPSWPPVTGNQHAIKNKLLNIPPNKGTQHLRQILRALALVAAAGEPPFIQLLGGSSPLPWGTTLIFITAGPTPELLLRSLHLYRTGYNVLLLLLQTTNQEVRKLRASWESQGIKVCSVRREEDLKGLEWVPARSGPMGGKGIVG